MGTRVARTSEKFSSRHLRRNQFTLRHGETVISPGWHGTGLSGALRADCPANFYVERRELFRVVWLHTNVAGDSKQTTADPPRRGFRHGCAHAAAHHLSRVQGHPPGDAGGFIRGTAACATDARGIS